MVEVSWKYCRIARSSVRMCREADLRNHIIVMVPLAVVSWELFVFGCSSTVVVGDFPWEGGGGEWSLPAGV